MRLLAHPRLRPYLGLVASPGFGTVDESLENQLPARYQIRSLLGRGGMATVYLAHDAKLDRAVAIKVMHPEFAESVGSDRFLREIRVTAQLRHPHILPLIDSGGTDDFLYYVMPFIEGGSLRDHLSKEGMLDLSEATRIASEIADALITAHDHQIVHRDIKPENVLLDSGHAVVADFGIAKGLSGTDGGSTTGAMIAVGTPAYMSPEQAGGEPSIDHRSDIYSLGCVLYEMLVGEPPFSGPSAQVVLARHVSQHPLPVRAVRSTIPEDLDSAVSRALNKSPADRFATAEEFRAVLQRISVDREPAAPNLMRRLALAVAAVAVLVVVVIGRPSGSGTPAPDPAKIAVLGFTYTGVDEALAAFAQNLTGRVIDGLSAIEALSVVSPRGVAPYADKSIPVDSIARALGVGTLVDGTVESFGLSVRIRFQVIDGETGEQVGSGFAEADLPHRHLLVDAVADTLIRLLQLELGPAIRWRTRLLQTQSLEAFEHVQWADERNKEFGSAFDAGDFTLADQMLDAEDSLLQRAERHDPNWVEPTARRAGLWESRFKLARARGDTSTMGLLLSGLERADQAVAKAPADPLARQRRGGLRYWLWVFHRPPDPDSAAGLIRAAETDLRDALFGSPDHAAVLRTLSELMAGTGRVLQAIDYVEQAYESDPYLENLAEVLLRLFDYNFEIKRDEAASRWCLEGAARRPTAMFAHCQLRLMAWGTTSTLDLARAHALKEETLAYYPSSMRATFEPVLDLLVAAVAARTGREAEARSTIERARRSAPRNLGFVVHEAGVLAILGYTTEAVAVVRAFVAENPDAASAVLRARELDALKRVPGFEASITDAARPPSTR